MGGNDIGHHSIRDIDLSSIIAMICDSEPGSSTLYLGTSVLKYNW